LSETRRAEGDEDAVHIEKKNKERGGSKVSSKSRSGLHPYELKRGDELAGYIVPSISGMKLRPASRRRPRLHPDCLQ